MAIPDVARGYASTMSMLSLRRLQKTLFAPKRRRARRRWRWRLWLRVAGVLSLGIYFSLLRIPLHFLAFAAGFLGLLGMTGASWYLWQRQQRSWRESVAEAYGRRQLDIMQPQAFEALVAQLFAQRGYRTELTPPSGDFGVDVLAYRQDERIAIQVKHYAHKVSGDAVREAVVGMQFYEANQAWVVTNSYLTSAAKQLAAKVGCHVLERDALLAWLQEAYEAAPDSSWLSLGLSRRTVAVLSLAVLALLWGVLLWLEPTTPLAYQHSLSLPANTAAPRVNTSHAPSHDTSSHDAFHDAVSVQFISEPEGVVLWLDGEPRGIAPVTLLLPRGQRLTLSAYADPQQYLAKHTELQIEEAGQVLLWLEPVP